MKKAARVVFLLAGPVLRWIPGRNRCPVCGAKLIVISRTVISDELAAIWQLSPHLRDDFDQREGELCLGCGSSLRVRHLATAITDWLQDKRCPRRPLAAAVSQIMTLGLRVAELNACGELHHILQRIPDLAYSEYRPTIPCIPHEDLLSLSYRDASFDLVLHSDTLEHVPAVHVALKELFRVLKPGGSTIFTVPIVRDGRPTVVRATLVDAQVIHLKPASYHGGSLQQTQQYLVYYEFGADFPEFLTACGFKTTMLIHPRNSCVVAFIATKPTEPHG